MNGTNHKLKLPFSDQIYQIKGQPQDESVPEALSVQDGIYEPWIMQILKRYIRSDSICLDIGANIGIISIAMSALALQGRVFAFEASKKNYELLKTNLSLNHITNVEPLQLAIYDRSGEVVFEHVNEFAAGSYISETAVHDHRAESERVHCVRLSDWVNSRAELRTIDLIKMDIEGAEIRALQGGQEVFRKYKPLLMVECNSYTLTHFQGQSPSMLYTTLQNIFPYVYLIDRGTAELYPLGSMQDFENMIIKSKSDIEDLLCSFEPLTPSQEKKRKFFFWRR